MSEPYDAGECPSCGSTQTQSWNHGTACELGYGCDCMSCGTRWDFPAASDITELDDLAATYAASRLWGRR